jgi:hypothetical protein
MTEAFHYPTLRLGLLHGMLQLKERIDADPDFLKSPSCPYDPETVEALSKIYAAKVIEKTIIKGGSDGVEKRGRGRPATREQALTEDQSDELELNAKELLKELKNLGDGGKTLETGERIQIIKAKAALVEQLLKAQERVLNVKRIAQFQAVVITILDDLIDETGRDEFLKRLEPYRD